MIKLLYELKKKSNIPGKDSENRENESKVGLHIDVTHHFSIFLF